MWSNIYPKMADGSLQKGDNERLNHHIKKIVFIDIIGIFRKFASAKSNTKKSLWEQLNVSAFSPQEAMLLV